MRGRHQALRAHALLVLAVAAGIAGTGIVFNGFADGNVYEVCRGVPLLCLGLWWGGRELGRSMALARTRREAQRNYRKTRR